MRCSKQSFVGLCLNQFVIIFDSKRSIENYFFSSNSTPSFRKRFHPQNETSNYAKGYFGGETKMAENSMLIYIIFEFIYIAKKPLLVLGASLCASQFASIAEQMFKREADGSWNWSPLIYSKLLERSHAAFERLLWLLAYIEFHSRLTAL